MKREIKFRAWNRDDNEPIFDPFESGLRFETLINVPSIILMQYTGLKDSAGHEIYEGDIIRTNEAGWVGYVVYNTGEYCLEDNKGGYCGDFSAWREIIGNIYENPELI